MLTSIAHAANCAGLQYVDAARTCSWYEHHMLGGCQRPHVPQESCLHHRSVSTATFGEHTLQEDGMRSPKLMVVIPFRGEASSSSFEHLCAHLPAHLDAHGVERGWDPRPLSPSAREARPKATSRLSVFTYY